MPWINARLTSINSDKASYAVLAVYTREVTIINMWAGQLLCEFLNWVVKRLVKQERPIGAVCVASLKSRVDIAMSRFADSVGNGYGFPSSHSQYMAFFATFLVLHLHCRHKFVSTGFWAVDVLWQAVVHFALIGWAVVVAYSR
ncbi:hypothetical protein HETIRDRAFT_440999 [Heterobasidion irregulare TC 32-1]|uniref:Phosphatidic acid phosphatase type 2/haloperoxidase domain-containing protein n=1 Tax=Heterobasidion irregulare (strain TC 32-1) TaxID=747525 RepID=W4JYP2_HETIT|nr:uncharacterized protein HETIRDRAFT_440999 [Heterobasidion irregulare TC 32-1]ETW78668.1 hypothetical protein HETIRDRAFT_440999 [Heterobasidion irregulare TC 32-1]